jgi:hypothetical protein
MELEIQKYLREHGEEASFKHFREELFLAVKEAADGKRVLFKYNQIDSPMANPICQEARGIILDRSDNWKVLSWPFRKFFNYGEGHAAKLDLSTARVLEKVDGTCISLYFFDGSWRVQTLGMLDAEGEVNNKFPPETFAELFKKTLGDDKFEYLWPKYAYTFELATPYNRVVTRYEKDRIVLLSIRHLKSLTEVGYGSPQFLAYYEEIKMAVPIVELPKTYSVAVNSLEEVAKMSMTLPQMDEGYVVVDVNFNRVKVKNPSYLALLHLKESSSSSITALVQLVLTNEGSEFLSYFPEFTDQYNRISTAIKEIKDKVQDIWEKAKHIENQKEFALTILAPKVPFVNTLFEIRKGKIKSVDEGFSSLDPKKVVETLRMSDAKHED